MDIEKIKELKSTNLIVKIPKKYINKNKKIIFNKPDNKKLFLGLTLNLNYIKGEDEFQMILNYVNSGKCVNFNDTDINPSNSNNSKLIYNFSLEKNQIVLFNDIILQNIAKNITDNETDNLNNYYAIISYNDENNEYVMKHISCCKDDLILNMKKYQI